MLSEPTHEVMAMQTASVKDAAHRLIDQLPDDADWENVLHAFQVRRDIEEGMADMEAGRVIDGDQVMTWIESWGTDNELDPPEL